MALDIPASRQKNRMRQVVPTIPAFTELLESVPIEQRAGYVFNPRSERCDRVIRDHRRTGRLISAIGKKAGIVVSDNGGHATAHDLRRTFGQNAADAGISPQNLQVIMRHKRYETTQRYYLRHDVSQQAERIAKTMAAAGTSTGTLPETGTDAESS